MPGSWEWSWESEEPWEEEDEDWEEDEDNWEEWDDNTWLLWTYDSLIDDYTMIA